MWAQTSEAETCANKFNEREPMSEIHNQLVATHEQLDLDEAQDRVQRILHGQAGPTLTPAPQTQPQAPATHPDVRMTPQGSVVLQRKPRSDKGIPKRPPADPDEIVLRLTLAEARNAAIACGKFDCYGIAEHIQDQIIAQLQKRLDLLTKQK